MLRLDEVQCSLAGAELGCLPLQPAVRLPEGAESAADESLAGKRHQLAVGCALAFVLGMEFGARECDSAIGFTELLAGKQKNSQGPFMTDNAFVSGCESLSVEHGASCPHFLLRVLCWKAFGSSQSRLWPQV